MFLHSLHLVIRLNFNPAARSGQEDWHELADQMKLAHHWYYC